MRKQLRIWYWTIRLGFRAKVGYPFAVWLGDFGMKLVHFSQKYRKSDIMLSEGDYESRYAVTTSESRYAK